MEEEKKNNKKKRCYARRVGKFCPQTKNASEMTYSRSIFDKRKSSKNGLFQKSFSDLKIIFGIGHSKSIMKVYFFSFGIVIL